MSNTYPASTSGSKISCCERVKPVRSHQETEPVRCAAVAEPIAGGVKNRANVLHPHRGGVHLLKMTFRVPRHDLAPESVFPVPGGP